MTSRPLADATLPRGHVFHSKLATRIILLSSEKPIFHRSSSCSRKILPIVVTSSKPARPLPPASSQTRLYPPRLGRFQLFLKIPSPNPPCPRAISEKPATASASSVSADRLPSSVPTTLPLGSRSSKKRSTSASTTSTLLPFTGAHSAGAS